MADRIALDLSLAERLIKNFGIKEAQAAARFHGDIGESKQTLDERAAREQSLVSQDSAEVVVRLKKLGDDYLKKFAIKFLISAGTIREGNS